MFAKAVFYAANASEEPKAQKKRARTAAADDFFHVRNIFGVRTGHINAVLVEPLRNADDPCGRNNFGKTAVVAAKNIIVPFSAYNTVKNVFSAWTFDERQCADGKRVHGGNDLNKVARFFEHWPHAVAVDRMDYEAAMR